MPMSAPHPATVLNGLAVVAASATLVMGISSLDTAKAFTWFLLAWGCVPYLALAGYVRRARLDVPALKTLRWPAAVATFPVLYALFDGMVASRSGQGGLLLIFLPLFQLVGTPLLVGVSRLVTRSRSS